MSWHDGRLAVLDLEATGVDTGEARIVEVGLLLFDPDGSLSSLVERMIDPGVALPAEVTELTGIHPEDLATRGGDPAEVLAATHAAIVSLTEAGIPIVVYNATYDWSLLANELARHGLDRLPAVPPAILVDPLVLDRYVDRYRKGSRTLRTVATHYGVRFDGGHRAAQDAAATVALARVIAESHPTLHMSGRDLVALQVAAYNEWRKSFNEYLARIDAARFPVTEEWPTG